MSSAMTPLLLIIFLMAGGFVFMAVIIIGEAKRRPGMRRWFRVVAGFLVAVGAVGFFGNAAGGIGGFLWLPNSFEWPAGYVNGVLTMPDGTHVVHHRPINRIQVYDSNWKFIRGWWLKDRRIKALHLRLKDNDKIEMITSHHVHYVYSAAGDLLSEEQLDSEPAGQLDPGESVWVPTPFWLAPFSGPFLAWATMISGMGLLFVLDKTKPKPVRDGKNLL